MTATLDQADLARALAAAGTAHHQYEVHYLGGERDEQWPGWYAAYILGRLGDFAPAASLTRWLEAAPGAADWSATAAYHVMSQLASQ